VLTRVIDRLFSPVSKNPAKLCLIVWSNGLNPLFENLNGKAFISILLLCWRGLVFGLLFFSHFYCFNLICEISTFSLSFVLIQLFRSLNYDFVLLDIFSFLLYYRLNIKVLSSMKSVLLSLH
jgi:hypothetical protein